MTAETRTRRWAIAAGLLVAIVGHRGAVAARDDAVVRRPIKPEEAARGVLHRVIPSQADRFVLASIPAEGGDVFEVEATGGRVAVRGVVGRGDRVGGQLVPAKRVSL